MQVTFQTKLQTTTDYLDAFATLFGRMERRLFVDHFIHGQSIIELKKHYQRHYEITARQFNALHYQVKGKVASVKELQLLRLSEYQQKINSIQAWIEKKETQKQKLFQKLSVHTKQDEPFKKQVASYRKLKFSLHHKKAKITKY